MSIGASLQSLFQGKREKVLGVSERLMLRYGAKGDEASLAALFDLHNHKLFYFLKMLSDSAVAEDICQRTWIKVIESRHLFKSGDNFQAWLFTIGRRTLIDEFRKNAKLEYNNDAVEAFSLAELVKHAQSSVEDDVQKGLEKDWFKACLQQLPYKQKEALTLQFEGFGLSEIAAICGAEKETVKTRIRYAKDSLKTMLEKM
ncbi:RNA polymerase sigma factor [Alteromonadaceae bacterium A_SAG4]|uniref:RNA polymerase sigma factor n=1 Tax=Alteromonas abrolhosensis TaxID=1892904 RepID=UPI0014487F7C|nr:RNA polymerase sigma factor [Alteromonadaceae bacterium A_SAG4]NKX04765.1 RNA polymerase sigma factor [Alteromonadaceae bacterium A_SAG6]NKX18183.1 RNA polymerase sigma factor [Alteromonadaceae bacterium A_SAG5]NKX35239.1 RNA polymerase sigma factor [Alteromonadaceae bacterium A_SAG3]